MLYNMNYHSFIPREYSWIKIFIIYELYKFIYYSSLIACHSKIILLKFNMVTKAIIILKINIINSLNVLTFFSVFASENFNMNNFLNNI